MCLGKSVSPRMLSGGPSFANNPIRQPSPGYLGDIELAQLWQSCSCHQALKWGQQGRGAPLSSPWHGGENLRGKLPQPFHFPAWGHPVPLPQHTDLFST